MFLSMVVGGVVTDFVLKKSMTAASYAEFIPYQNRRSGFDAQRFERPLYAAVIVLSLATAVLISNWYAYVTPRNLVVHPFFAFEAESIPLDQIADIVTAPKLRAIRGNEIARREYVIRARDGRTWSTQSDPSNMSAARKRELAAYLSRQSGVPIREVPVFSWSEAH
jgi:hypothetical protein